MEGARWRESEGRPSDLEIRRDGPGKPFTLWNGRSCCARWTSFGPSWQNYRTKDGATPSAAGVEQLGDMLVVNVRPAASTSPCGTIRHSSAAASAGTAASTAVETMGRSVGRSSWMPRSHRLEEVLRVRRNPRGASRVPHGRISSRPERNTRYLPVVEAHAARWRPVARDLWVGP